MQRQLKYYRTCGETNVSVYGTQRHEYAEGFKNPAFFTLFILDMIPLSEMPPRSPAHVQILDVFSDTKSCHLLQLMYLVFKKKGN